MDYIIHLDEYIAQITQAYGTATYLILFLVLFAETGFVVTPFLPGDSLLFAIGALAALGSLNLPLLLIICITAAILGDTVNYAIGHYFGQRIVDNPRIKFINQKHIDKTQAFYAKYGAKTIVLARFVPIVRTFAPFVAGVGKMHYRTFLIYNVVGGVVWIILFTMLGYLFGNIPVVKDNFALVVLAIILISLLPMGWELLKSRRAG